MKANVAVIYGGDSSEIVISVKSAQTVRNNLDGSRYNVYMVELTRQSWVVVEGESKFSVDRNDFSFIKDGKKIKIECALIIIHGTPGENGKLQAYFDLIGIPYAGCGQLESAVTFNKFWCNSMLMQFGISCAQNYFLIKGQDIDQDDILNTVGLPCFVKPNQAGSSFGISKVARKEDLSKAIEKAFEEDTQVIIEQFLQGTEVSAGIIELNGKLIPLPITEIVSENDFFDFEAKYEGKSSEITPARIDDKLTQKVQNLTRKVFQLLNLSGLSRIDFMLVGNEPYVIEVNTIPGMSPESIIPQQCKEAGIGLDTLFNGLVEDALEG